jgi:glutamate-5-semialdehyde dehydrogenase
MLQEMGARARAAALELAVLRPAAKNGALVAMADAFLQHAEAIIAENAKDLIAAEKNGLGAAALDRLRLTQPRIEAMAKGLREVAALPDPVGEIFNVRTRPNGLQIGQMRAPIGVIGIIYESRPNVTADAGALCLKSGNATILRGGSEAFHSNQILARLMDEASASVGLPSGAIQFIPTTDRAAVGEMLKLKESIDLIIPRGGKPLIERITKESQIPVIKHLDGNCTVFVDESADLEMAVRILVNSKAQRTGVCNAAETFLVHRAIAEQFLPMAAAALAAAKVEVRGDETVCRLVPGAKPATEQDWYEEYLDLIIAGRVVDDVSDAIRFINKYGSHHTETIVTQNHPNAMLFLRAVDSSCLHINCSTRFSDGGEYGLGAEIGISTDKLHARGPMGLLELTTPKWIAFGDGQIRG